VAETFGADPVANLYVQRTPKALCRDLIGATLYFSARGVGAFSPSLPMMGFPLLVTFWPLCNEFALAHTRSVSPVGGSEEGPGVRHPILHALTEDSIAGTKQLSRSFFGVT
jgi:hypothetical protein